MRLNALHCAHEIRLGRFTVKIVYDKRLHAQAKVGEKSVTVNQRI